jgi:hypothetical protein
MTLCDHVYRIFRALYRAFHPQAFNGDAFQ